MNWLQQAQQVEQAAGGSGQDGTAGGFVVIMIMLHPLGLSWLPSPGGTLIPGRGGPLALLFLHTCPHHLPPGFPLPSYIVVPITCPQASLFLLT